MEVVWALGQRRADVESKDKAGCLRPVLPGHPRMSLSCSLNMASTFWTRVWSFWQALLPCDWALNSRHGDLRSNDALRSSLPRRSWMSEWTDLLDWDTADWHTWHSGGGGKWQRNAWEHFPRPYGRWPWTDWRSATTSWNSRRNSASVGGYCIRDARSLSRWIAATVPQRPRGNRPCGCWGMRKSLEPRQGGSEENNPLTSKCAHAKLSQPRGSPQLPVPDLC